MSSFIAAKPGNDATGTGIQNTLINSNYQTVLVSASQTGNIAVAGPNGNTSLVLGSSLGFVPYPIFLSDYDNKGSGPYYLASPTQPGGSVTGLISGDPWKFYFTTDSFTNSYTAHYMYYITYLPSQGPSTAPNSGTQTEYMNIAQSGGNALTDYLENLSYSSQVQSLQIISHQTFTISYMGTGNVITKTIAHGLSSTCLFNGVITNYTGVIRNFSDLGNNGYQFGIDNTNFYFIDNVNTNGTNYSYNFSVFFYPQP